MSVTTLHILWVRGGLWILGRMVPTRFQNCGIFFLLLTGASLIVGISLGVGYAAQPFKSFF